MKKNDILDERTLPLEQNQFYHIYNRGNNKTTLFYNPENYRYFLEKYVKYMAEYIDTFAYCLLPNHFHFLIKVKSISDLPDLKGQLTKEKEPQLAKSQRLGKFKPINDNKNNDISKMISNQFRLLFMSYAKAINKQENLKGSLFQKIFRRKRIDDSDYLHRLVGYIHKNPLHHNIFNSIEKYRFSSYSDLISNKPTFLKRDEVMDWFGDKNDFIESHKAVENLIIDNKYWMEE